MAQTFYEEGTVLSEKSDVSLEKLKEIGNKLIEMGYRNVKFGDIPSAAYGMGEHELDPSMGVTADFTTDKYKDETRNQRFSVFFYYDTDNTPNTWVGGYEDWDGEFPSENRESMNPEEFLEAAKDDIEYILTH